jgi:hypothetical protein
MSELLENLQVVKGQLRIPLCRMVPQFTERMPNEIDQSVMGRHLEGGYIKGQAAFYVSLENKDHQSTDVTDAIRSTWDAH